MHMSVWYICCVSCDVAGLSVWSGVHQSHPAPRDGQDQWQLPAARAQMLALADHEAFVHRQATRVVECGVRAHPQKSPVSLSLCS